MDKFIIRRKCDNVASVSDDGARPSVSGAVRDNKNIDSDGTVAVTKNTVPRKKKSCYQPSWKQQFTWIDYNKVKDVIFCKNCRHMFEENRFQFSHKIEKPFMETGFSNWKKGVEKLKAHEASGCHREAVLKFKSLKSNVNVFSQISKEKLTQMKENRACLLKIISSLRYLAAQGLAIRGHTEETSNFDNLLRLRCEDNQLLLIWLQRETYKWTSHDVLNEILAILSHEILRKLLEDIKRAKYLAIIADETTDIANKEQFSICIRFFDASLEIEEYFLGLYSIQSTTAKPLFDIIIDILRRFDLPTSNCRGQCYDGPANMAGLYNGVQTNFMEMEKRAMFVH
ncbi:zinc finger MYM-type protein 1-like [Schistocerca americana]|uniref:zinc finger MYM-type protein 1-like n=1 Tax=Schistocerca americana TaxID=7009 RepID=UPI001F4F74A4|nr:zinc finger MYM-type protein 1-like [Schistocerca americana]